MDRRKYLALASGGIAALAGCSGFRQRKPPVRDSDTSPQGGVDEENDEPSRLEIRDVRFNGGELVVKVSDSLGVADHVEIQSETGQGMTLQVKEYEARGKVLDPETAGRPDVRALGPGEATVVLYDDENVAVDEASFEYKPDLSLGVRPAARSIYRNATDPEASALFTFSNSGVGPVYFESFEVQNAKNTVQLTEPDDLGNEKATFLRTGEADGLASDLFEPVGVDDEEQLNLSEGSPISYGADGIFAHIGPQPQPTDSFEQVFEVVARTELNREYVFEVTVLFSGGIVESSMATEYETPVYRFKNFEIDVEQIAGPQER